MWTKLILILKRTISEGRQKGPGDVHEWRHARNLIVSLFSYETVMQWEPYLNVPHLGTWRILWTSFGESVNLKKSFFRREEQIEMKSSIDMQLIKNCWYWNVSLWASRRLTSRTFHRNSAKTKTPALINFNCMAEPLPLESDEFFLSCRHWSSIFFPATPPQGHRSEMNYEQRKKKQLFFLFDFILKVASVSCLLWK